MEAPPECTSSEKACGEEVLDKKSNLETKAPVSCNEDACDTVDEDAVLGGDEATKDIDGNIDEDELLKDTDTDDVRKNVECDDREVVSNSESPTVNNDTVEASMLDNNQNVNSSENFVEGNESNSTPANINDSNKNYVDSTNCTNKPEALNTSVSLNCDDSVASEKNETNINDTIDNVSKSYLSINNVNSLNNSTYPEKVSWDSDNKDSGVTGSQCVEKEINTNRDKVEDNETIQIAEGKSECAGAKDGIIKSITGDTIAEEIGNTPKDSREDTLAPQVNSPSNNSASELTNNQPNDEDCDQITEAIDKEVGGTSENILEQIKEQSENKNNNSADKKVITTEVTTKGNELNNTEKQNENKIETTDVNEGTKFVHVEQENSRPDEAMEVTENSVEDPFAQTSDEVMDTSENVEKDPVENSDTSKNYEPMEVNDATSNLTIESDIDKATDATPTDTSNKKIEKDGDEKTVDSLQIASKVIDKINEKEQKQPVEITIEDDDENNLITKVNSSKRISDVLKNTLPVLVNSSKSKVGRTSKSRAKSKATSSGESTEEDDCLDNLEMGTKSGNRPKRSAAQRAESQIKVLTAVEREDVDSVGVSADLVQAKGKELEPPTLLCCHSCKKMKKCMMNIMVMEKKVYFCGEACFSAFKEKDVLEIMPPTSCVQEMRPTASLSSLGTVDRSEFIRKCSQCSVNVREGDDKSLSWETMEFCSEDCLGKYQQELGSHCANCKGNVQPASLGKYCVRFGYEVKQFCCSSCLEEFKKGLKVCSFCQKDISSGVEGFLAPVGDKGTFKDFCTQACMEKYEHMSSNQPPPAQMHVCHVCNNNKLVEVEVLFDAKVNKLCSVICFNAYKFANSLEVDQCDMCKKYFDKDVEGEKFNIFYESEPHNFCCKTCLNVYILAKRKIVPCNWCKVKKYNFDMIKRVQSTGHVLMMCSLNCLTLYNVSINAVSSRRIKCDMCKEVTQAQYHLTMSDATMRNFCTYPCVMNFQQQYGKSPITLPGSEGTPVPTGAPKRILTKANSGSPIITSVASLANGQPSSVNSATVPMPSKMAGKPGLVTRLVEPPKCRNKNTQTRPIMNTKSVSCRPHSTSVHVQTEDGGKPVLIPIPIPIYVPCPMAMYSLPFPVPVPFPVPIPVPVFLPTTRNSIKGIIQEIKRIKEKVPDDPFEAELLMMAEMVAEDKKQEATSSESEADNDNEPAGADSGPNSDEGGDYNSEPIETNNAFGEDIVEMALKMATELDEPAGDLETHLLNQQTDEKSDGEKTKKAVTGERGRKRALQRSPHKRTDSSERKKRKPSIHSEDSSSQPTLATEEPKPDANMKLKYTFGVNAWKSWVSQKNAEIEELNATATKKLKTFKNDILQLTTDELNFSLCLFVKEVKKPNGAQYAPDTIFYLCLGIQQYLFENGRIDNIFTDTYYETFTDTLDEVAKKFSELFNDHHYIVTRVEEEHLWESKQLGAHSPHVLLSTLMFFNTKHFNLISVDEHMLLSFSHIMKHWKRVNAASSTNKPPANRNVLLRFYPPQALLDDPTAKKKKVYEQHENEENPLRCPVKLYEFYLSKCPDSVRSRNDVFYLQPERSCVPDSPVWYSTMALGREPLEKMLNRVKMIKEINIALLTP